MFFKPPKVKSLSRYAEYGAYLGNQHFLMMLAIAFTVHMGVIVIYSMSPSQDVIRIPVRPLNIKLTGGGSMDNGIHIPPPSSMPVLQAPEEKSKPDNDMHAISESQTAEAVMDDALKEPEKKAATVKKQPPAEAARSIHLPAESKKSRNHASESSFATPKRYVREGDVTKAKVKSPHAQEAKNGSEMKGDEGGSEAIERYTQTVSQWIKNHQAFARAAYKEAAQGQGSVQGQAVIRLRIDREGRILYNSVDRTSGNELVDELAIAMVRASDPVPAVPSDYPSDSQLEFLIAVQVDFSKQ